MVSCDLADLLCNICIGDCKLLDRGCCDRSLDSYASLSPLLLLYKTHFYNLYKLLS